jgi:hypothetical protein
MAFILPKKNGRTLQTFPRALEIRRREKNKMMKTLKQLFFVAALVVGVSIPAFAQQKEGDKKPPPKEKPPTIEVEPKKKPKEEKPKDDKKPQFMMYKSKYTISLVQDK